MFIFKGSRNVALLFKENNEKNVTHFGPDLEAKLQNILRGQREAIKSGSGQES